MYEQGSVVGAHLYILKTVHHVVCIALKGCPYAYI